MVTLETSFDTGHEDIVHDAQMDFYGRYLATCSADSSVKIFEIFNEEQKVIKEFREHQGPVWQVAWSYPQFGIVLASCGYDKKIILYSQINDEWLKVREIVNHDSSVNSISWSPPEYGPILASGSSDGSVALTTLQPDGNIEPIKIPQAHKIGVNSVDWAPIFISEINDTKKVVKRFVSAGCDNDVKLYVETAEGWAVDRILRGHSDWVMEVAWRPTTIMKEEAIASADKLGRVFIWSKQSADKGEWQRIDLMNYSNDPVWHLSWSVSGDMLSVSSGENKITLWRQSLDGQWTNISGVGQGEGDNSVADD